MPINEFERAVEYGWLRLVAALSQWQTAQFGREASLSRSSQCNLPRNDAIA